MRRESKVLAIGLVLAGGAVILTRSAAPLAAAGPLAALAASDDTLRLTSPAFRNGGALPRSCTCDGDDQSPPLAWSGVPEGAKSIALLIDDPDAPDPAAPKVTWTHWLIYNLPPSRADSLAAGVKPSDLRGDARMGMNDWKKTAYGGPCPPVGRHRYYHHLYALDTVLTFKHPPDRAEFLRAIEGHVIAKAELLGTYQRSK